jgi:hypothetical protein
MAEVTIAKMEYAWQYNMIAVLWNSPDPVSHVVNPCDRQRRVFYLAL